MADSRNSDDARSQPVRQIAGPLNGYYLSAADTPVLVYDLTLEGCVVALNGGTLRPEGSRLQIDLPGEGWTVLYCETLHMTGPNAYAVQFVLLNDVTRGRITRAIDHQLGQAKGDSISSGESQS
jgi:hypothetical protein